MSDGWSDIELEAAVEAYLEMQQKARLGESFVKKHYYKDLATRFGRSDKAFEYRMQNISYVMSLLGRSWLSGLKPARNVGANIAADIEALIGRNEGTVLVPKVAFEIETQEAVKKRIERPAGSRKPAATSYTATQYQRDATVRAWVLQQARGICECCERPAPFKGPDGAPFLEVHHVRQLAEQGSDTVTNAVALCPNCHRELHFGERSKALISSLYGRIPRLVPE